MERNCKSSVKRLRNWNVVNEDRISELPDDLLMKILSLLTTDIVVATSVLSKRWRSLWKLVPTTELDYHDCYGRPNYYSEDMLRYFISHKAPVLETLSLCFARNHKASEIETGIRIAFARHVRKLLLECSLYEQDVGLVKFPSELCSCNSTLEILILKDLILLDFPSRVSLKFLRKLHLDSVRFTDEESFRNLLCGCPSLEDLSVINTNVHTFTIAVPSLQRLTIVEGHNPEGRCVINSSSLKYLSIKGFSCCEFPVIENVPKLVEAKILTLLI